MNTRATHLFLTHQKTSRYSRTLYKARGIHSARLKVPNQLWYDHLHFASNLKTSVSDYKLSGVATPLHKKEGSGHKNNTNLAVAKCNCKSDDHSK